jgi:phosphate transport system permease protein
MTPLIARASVEALSRVPGTLREAADALGVARWRTVLGIILPSALNGIVTATILASARAAGETAPLLFTTTLYGSGYQLNPLHALPNIPFEIYSLSEAGYPDGVTKAWGAAFVLLAAILIANIAARTLVGRSQRRLGR